MIIQMNIKHMENDGPVNITSIQNHIIAKALKDYQKVCDQTYEQETKDLYLILFGVDM